MFWLPLLFFTGFTAQGDPLLHDLDGRTLTHVDTFLNREHRYDVTPGHETVVRLQRDHERVAQKTRYAVVLISGLYNSPAAVRPIETYFVGRKHNVISLRLAGHYEADRRSLNGEVRWPTWKMQAERALTLARELGDEVILVGHSTGGLLCTWMAVEQPAGIAGLAVFAPAFAIHRVSGLGVTLMRALNFGREIPAGRYVTGHAADQVRQMGVAFADALAQQDADDPYGYAARRLNAVSAWMGNTDLDRVIDLKTANAFFAALEREGSARRGKHVRPICEGIIHDKLASAANPHLAQMLRSLGVVLLP